MCLHFVSISIYFLFFNFEFYVVVNVLFGMTAYGRLIIQCGLLESLVSLTFNLPLFFVSMFQYQSWTIKHPTYHNPRLHHRLSSLLIDCTGMIRCPSINIALSLWFVSNDISFMRFGMRLGDEGRGVDEKGGIICGLVFFSLYKFLIWFLIHPYKISDQNSSITAA